MNRIAGRAWSLLLIVSMLLGGLGFFLYEYGTKSESWALHSGNSQVYTGSQLSLNKGTVVDRDGNFLLNLADNRSYSTDGGVRKATLHWLGDRAGYISAPAITHYAKQMLGYDGVNGLYTYGSQSGQATLTLSASVQKAALEAMGNRKGTVAVYNYQTGELICAISTPTYDPDNIPSFSADPDAYEGVYFNRFLQSAYIPGSIFKLVTTAAALETIPDIQEQTFTCTGSYTFDTGKVTCEQAHGTMDLKKAMLRSCNCAYAQIAVQLGAETLRKFVDDYGVTASISFDGIATAAGNVSLESAAAAELAWSAIGQHKDQINPCAFLTFVGAIANGGQGVTPHVVQSVTVAGETTYSASAALRERIMSEETASALAAMMRNNVKNHYGDENFHGLTVCAKSGTGEVGGGLKPNAMFTGFVLDEELPLAFIVCVEQGGYGRTTCIPIISAVLAECKKVLSE